MYHQPSGHYTLIWLLMPCNNNFWQIGNLHWDLCIWFIHYCSGSCFKNTLILPSSLSKNRIFRFLRCIVEFLTEPYYSFPATPVYALPSPLTILPPGVKLRSFPSESYTKWNPFAFNGTRFPLLTKRVFHLLHKLKDSLERHIHSWSISLVCG